MQIVWAVYFKKTFVFLDDHLTPAIATLLSTGYNFRAQSWSHLLLPTTKYCVHRHFPLQGGMCLIYFT
jgi:hypothetical protein